MEKQTQLIKTWGLVSPHLSRHLLSLFVLLTMLVVGNTKAWADTDKLTAQNGWTKVTDLSTLTLSDYYFAFVDDTRDLMLSFGEGYNQTTANGYKTMVYRTGEKAEMNPNMLWILETNNNGSTPNCYSIRNAYNNTNCIQTENNAPHYCRIHDQSGSNVEWCKWIFTYADSKWTIQNGKYTETTQYIGPWGAANFVNGAEVAGNKTEGNVGYFQIYAIKKTNVDWAAKANAINPANYTYKITNPDFEGTTAAIRLNGWTNSGTQAFGTQNNASLTNKTGTYYAQTWHQNGTMDINQTLSNMPAGKYVLRANAVAGQNGRLYVGSSEITVTGTINTYEVETNLAVEGSLTIGFSATDNNTLQWNAVDNFQLYYYGPDAVETTWNFSEYTTQVNINDNLNYASDLKYAAQYTKNNMTLLMVGMSGEGTTEYAKNTAGFHCNGSSYNNGNFIRYIAFTPPVDGTWTVTGKGNGKGAANSRIVAIGTSIANVTDVSRLPSSILAAVNVTEGVDANSSAISADVQASLTAGTTYYAFFGTGGSSITKLVFTPGSTPATYTVTYDLNGHGDAIAAVPGVTALPNPLPAPTADGWDFGGWYTDNGLTNAAVAGAAIAANTTLYAKWTETPSGAVDITLVGTTPTANKSPLTNVEYGISQTYTSGNYVLTGSMSGNDGKRYIAFTVPAGYTATVDATLAANSNITRHLAVCMSRSANEGNSYLWLAPKSDGTSSGTSSVLEAGTYYVGSANSGLTITELIVHVTQGQPAVAPKADFVYGYTSWSRPEAGDVTITLPAHKAGSQITLDVTPEDGANVDEVINGTYAANKLSFTAPAAGSNMTVTFPVTKDEVTTEYSIVVSTETKVGQNFDPEKRYSQILIDARKDDFKSNTNSGGLGYTGKNNNLDYVPGLVAKSIIEAVDYYKDHKNATIDDAKLQAWFNAVKTYGNLAITENGKAGKSFDDLNAVKIYFGLKDVAASGKVTGITADNDAWNGKLGLALTGIKNASTTYAISSSHATYPISIAEMQGGLWHKADYINQMWGDGQYMGTAFLAQLINDTDVYDANNASKRVTANDWDFVAKQINIYHTYAWDNTYNLPHHAFAADKGTNAISHSDTWKMDGDTYHNEGIWGRAAGWYFMALVDILEQMQKANVTGANYNTVKNALDAVAAGIKARQDNATGLWYQLPIFDETFSNADYNSSNALAGRKYNYLESSASALFTAAYLKAMRVGLLDKGTYEATAKKAYQGFVENFIDANNNIYWSCRSAGLGGSGSNYEENGSRFRDGSNAYYLKGFDVAPIRPDENLTEGKALGAFIMAAVEYERAYLAADELVCGDDWQAQKTSTHPLASGQTMHITFNNVSTKSDATNEGWFNWILAAGSGETGADTYNKFSLRADKYDINTSAQMGEITINGNSINWETFVTDMKAGADVDIYVSNSGSNLYVKAVSTATNSGNVYTYTAQNSNSADNVYISLMGQNCTLTKIEFEDPVAAVTITATESQTSARVKNGMGLDLANGSAVQVGETIVLEAKANDGFAFRTWKDAPAGTSIVASPSGDGYDYKYRIDALNASATVQAKGESTTVVKYLPTTNNNYYNFAIVDGIKDYVVESGKGTGDYDMLNFANITGGVTTLYNGGSSDGAMVYAPAKAVNLNGSSAAYMKVDILNTNAEGYRAVQAGDVITFTGEGELKIGITADHYQATFETSDKTYTVQVGDAIIGATTLYFFKKDRAQISTLNIMHPLPQHTITFNGNGNTGGNMEAQIVDEGIPTPIANNGFSRNAYILKGWNTAADGSGTNYVQNADITLTGDVTLYAMWQRFSPKGSQGATIVAEGGDVAGYTITFETSQNLNITSDDFEISSSDNNILTAAFRDMSGGVRFNVHGVTAGAADVIIRFKGRENTLFGESECRVTFTVKAPDAPRTVTFDGSGNGTSQEAALTETAVGSGITLPRVTPLAGHTFLGWSTKADATKPDAGLTEGATYYPSDNTVLYAVYSTGTTIGNANTSFFGAFSDFVKLDEGKSENATYSNRGGSLTYENWSVIATSNNTGHNGDGVQDGNANERFVLRADGNSWGTDNGAATMYRSNDGGATYTELANVIASSSDADKTEFIEAMKNATNVDFSASRVGEYVYIYVTTTCSNGKRYVETYKSGSIAVDQPVYLSWTTEKSTITFSDQSSQDAFLVSGESAGNGIVTVKTPEGINVNNIGVPAGTQMTYQAYANSGYVFQKWSDETTENPTVKTISATTNLVASFVPAAYNYTVRAVDSKGNVLNANIASGTYTYGDPAITVAYPQHILSGTTLYEIANNGSGDWFRTTFTPDRQNYVLDLQYKKGTVDNVVFYTEAENITGFTSYAMTNRASNGTIAHSGGVAKTTTCVLPAGLYQIKIRGCNGNSASRTVNFTDGTNNIVSLTIDNNNNNVTKSSAIFQLTSEKTLHVSSEGSSSSGLDWFYVKKYDDVLMVNENGQRYTLTKDNAADDAFFTSSTGTSNWALKTINGQKEYVLDMKSNRTETVRVTGARSYEIIVMNNGASDVNLSVGGENKPITAKTTSSTGLIPINDPNGVTTISFTNTSGNTIYPYQIIFYTTDPEATLNTDEITVKVGKTTTFDLSTASRGTITMTAGAGTNSYARDIAFNNSTNKLTMTGVSKGSFDLTFNIAAGEGYTAATGYKLKVHVEKQTLELKYTPEFYKYNVDTEEETNNLTPSLSAMLVDDDGNKTVFDLSSVTVNYASDDESVATVTSGGAISKVGSGQGSADITAVVNDNTYKSNVANFTVMIEQGVTVSLAENKTPTVGEVLTVTDTDGETPLVYATFGGWKWGKNGDKNDHSYDFPGSSSAKTDSWAKTIQYSGTKDAKPNYVDGYSWQSGGKNDAADEYKGVSDDNIFGKPRYGWYRPNSDAHIAPFSLPVRGTYMTFEPQQNGMLTVYILQNGAFNSSTAADGSSKVIAGEFQPHSFHVVDQTGTPVTYYTDFNFIVKEHVTQRTRDGKLIVCGYDQEMEDSDQDNGEVPAGVIYDESDVATWPAFYTNFSKEERHDIKAAWTGGNNDAQDVVELHDGSFFITQKAYVKYTFYVAASQTYYLFSNFSKMGFAAVNFVKDANQPDQVNDVLALNDAEDFPTLKNANTNVSNKLSVPQYGKITVNRSFTPGDWNTICLPFDMTEREVEKNFGKGTVLQCFDGTQVNEHNSTLHFVYHEIQSILAGYPYLIKPTGTGVILDGSGKINGITVYNKLIQPKNTGDAHTPVLVYNEPKEFVDFSTSRYWTNTPYVTETTGEYTFRGTIGAATPYKKGDLYMSTANGGTWKRMSADSGNLKGYRAFIQSNSTENYSKPLLFSLGFYYEEEEEDIPTTLYEVEFDDDSEDGMKLIPVEGVFNLAGQKVSDDLQNLPCGIYVVNGKKFYVK